MEVEPRQPLTAEALWEGGGGPSTTASHRQYDSPQTAAEILVGRRSPIRTASKASALALDRRVAIHVP